MLIQRIPMDDDRSSFQIVFGSSPKIKILDFFLIERARFDYTLTEIAEGAEVSWATINALFPGFVKLGIVKETRKIARATLYTLNEANPLTQELIRVHNAVAAKLIEAELARQAGRKQKAVAVPATRRRR